jgi:hypothetical protein
MALALDGTTGISASGNITGGNVIASGALIVGSFTPASLNTAGNVTGGNITTAGLVTATGNVTGGNVLTGGLISATGAITGATLTGTSLTVTTGNITGGNLLLSGAIIDSAQLDIQTSAANANIALAPNGTGIVTVSTQVSAVGNVTGGNIRTAGLISATGSITAGGDLSLVGNIVDTGPLTVTTSSNGNITLSPNGTGVVIINTANPATFGSTGLGLGTGNLSLGNIFNNNANGVGNIGASGASFNTIFAKATSAQYADLAEMYLSDVTLHPGTVVEFGGSNEITISVTNHSSRVAGIISTRPSHLMNATLTGEHAYPVALTGRVPCTVIGKISKGDCLVSSDHPGAAQRLNSEKFVPGCIIGKALQDHDSDSIGTIEVAVGRF